MYIHVLVNTQAKQEKIIKKKDDYFEVWVKEKSERNQANKKVCALIANYFNLTEKEVHIVSGHKRPKKILSLRIENNI